MGNLYNDRLNPYQPENQLLAAILLSFAFLNLFDGIEVDLIKMFILRCNSVNIFLR